MTPTPSDPHTFRPPQAPLSLSVSLHFSSPTSTPAPLLSATSVPTNPCSPFYYIYIFVFFLFFFPKIYKYTYKILYLPALRIINSPSIEKNRMDPASRYRFLGIPSSTSSSSSLADGNGDSNGNGDELNEDDILWTNDYTDQSLSNSSSSSPTTTSANNLQSKSNHLTAFPKNSGILAALPETNHNTVLYRKPSLPSSSSSSSSSSRAIPLIPRSPHVAEYASQSVPIRKLNQSAPMNVPVLSIAMAKQRNSRFKEDDDGEFDGDEEMLPPHEIVARGSRRSPKTTFSVLEGVGRTLKGRDLRQVRNAVWRQTGFLD